MLIFLIDDVGAINEPIVVLLFDKLLLDWLTYLPMRKPTIHGIYIHMEIII